jgi:hypothetical protein
MLIYIAGPYRGDVDRSIQQAREIAIAVWEAGHVAICPHLNTAHFEQDCDVSDAIYLIRDLQILARCDACVFTPDWERSEGARMEREFCQEHGIPEYTWPSMPALHPTEIDRPDQVEAFMDVLMRMYRVHLDKNADYSPANILGTGEIGLVTRLWDKVARLMNLSGFRIEISHARFTTPQAPKNESIDDTLIDLANYGVIGFLLRKGVWGK